MNYRYISHGSHIFPLKYVYIFHMILCMGNEMKIWTCKLKDVIMQEKGILQAMIYLDLIISASDYYCFKKKCVLECWIFDRIPKFP